MSAFTSERLERLLAARKPMAEEYARLRGVVNSAKDDLARANRLSRGEGTDELREAYRKAEAEYTKHGQLLTLQKDLIKRERARIHFENSDAYMIVLCAFRDIVARGVSAGQFDEWWRLAVEQSLSNGLDGTGE